MDSKKTGLIFGLVLAGAFLLYLPALPLADALARNLPKAAGVTLPPENGFLPFMALYLGAAVAAVILYRSAREGRKLGLWGFAYRAALQVAAGALAECFLLTVLARGWEGFLVWFNPAFWLLALALAALGLVTGGLWGILANYLTERAGKFKHFADK